MFSDLLQQWFEYNGALPADVSRYTNDTVEETTTQLPVVLSSTD